jgi:WD40 repeat protein
MNNLNTGNEIGIFNEAFDKIKNSPRKLKILSGMLGNMSDKDIAAALETTEGTVRKQISLICKMFGLTESVGRAKRAELVYRFAEYQPDFLLKPETIEEKQHIDFSDAPDGDIFYGRDKELSELQKWIINDNCRLVSILGIGGIGKTSLSIKLAKSEKIRREFKNIIWRDLARDPSIDSILKELIKFISYSSISSEPDDKTKLIDWLITQLIFHLKSSRCLIILDNFETVLRKKINVNSQKYIESSYISLLMRLALSDHKGCLIITSREQPEEINMLEGKLVKKQVLSGLSKEATIKMLENIGLIQANSDSNEPANQFNDLYGGNPLAIKILTSHIIDLFDGKIENFLSYSSKFNILYSGLENLLSQQFNRLENYEKSILYWLAINQEKTSIEELYEDIVPKEGMSILIQGIKTLKNCSLIEVDSEGCTLITVVREYIIDRLVREIIEEIKNEEFDFFGVFPLIKATSKDYVINTQIQLILKPVLDTFTPDSLIDFKDKLFQGLRKTKSKYLNRSDYAAGNVLNLLLLANKIFSGVYLSSADLDFTNMKISQAYLKGEDLHDFNFSGSDLSNSVFTQCFGTVLTLVSTNVLSESKKNLWATGDTNNEIHLWEGESQYLIFKGHKNWIRSIAFSPDGKILASGSDDKTIKIWNVETGQCLDTLEDHKERVWSVVFSPDGKILASGSEDKTIILWSVENDKFYNLQEIKENLSWVRSIAFSPDGKKLASGNDNGEIKFWGIINNQAVEENKLLKTTSKIRSIAFSPNGRFLVSSGNNCIVNLWDLSNNTSESKKYEDHDVWIRSVIFSPDSKTFASGSEDGTIIIRKVDGYSEKSSAQRDGTNESTKKSVYQPTNLSSQTSHDTDIVKINGHDGRIRSLAFINQGNTLISTSDDQTIKFWDIKGKCHRSLEGYTNWSWSVSFSFNDKFLASSNDDKVIRIWNIENLENVSIFKDLKGHTKRSRTINFHPEKLILASGSDDETIKIWDVSNGTCIKTLKGHEDRVLSVAFNHDGKILASGGDDQIVRIWNVETGQCLSELNKHKSWIWSVAFSPNGEMLASASEDKTVKLWDIKTGEVIASLDKHNSWVRSVAFSPNGEMLASASEDKTIKLWDLKNNKPNEISEYNNYNWVRSIAFNPDSQSIASAGEGETIMIWKINTKENRNDPTILSNHTQRIWSIAFSSDGKLLAGGIDDGSVKIWHNHNYKDCSILKSPRIYEGINITNVKGLTEAEINNLIILGAYKND